MPLFWLALAFLAGILLADTISLPTLTWLLLAGAAFISCILLALLAKWRARRASTSPPGIQRLPTLFSPAFIALAVSSAFLGAWRFQSIQPNFYDPNFIAWYNQVQGRLIVEGVIIEPPDVRDTYVNLRVAVDKVRLATDATSPFRNVHGALLAQALPGEELNYGDRVQLAGNLETPPEDEQFSYRDYLARQGIYSYMRQASARLLQRNQGNPVLVFIYRLKKEALATVYRLFPDPEASLLAGILLGVDTGIPQNVQQAFKATGTSHIIAISGFNVGIVAALFMAGFGRLLGQRWGTVLAILGIGLYTVLVGASFSVLRAALMGSVALFARQFGRQTGINSLGITAGVLAGFSPYALWDPGFQLSFGATLGLVLYADALQDGFANLLVRHLPLERARRLAGLVGEYFLFTLAAQVMTLPIIAYQFQRISLVSVLTNPVVLPVQPPLMIFGGLAVVAGMAWRPLGQVISYLAWPFLGFTIRAIEAFASIPGGNIPLGSTALVVVIGIYLVILALTVWRAQAREKLLALGPATLLTAIGLAAAFAWRVGYAAPDGRLHVTLLDVSTGAQSGDGILIRTPDGRSLLIDGGPSAVRLSDALGQRLPPTERGLDWLVVALPGNEQTTSLSQVLDRFHPAGVLWAGPEHDTSGARNLQAALVQRGISQVLAVPGQGLDLGKGAALRVLTAGKRGATLLLEWGSFRMLLPLGIDGDDRTALEDGKTIGKVSALLLADAGSAASNPPEWIAALQPQVTLISVSPADLQDLPAPETLDLLQGYTLLRTDRNGWIELSTDGEQMWVEVERK